LDVQTELEIVLNKLQIRYGRGKELHVEWKPCTKKESESLGKTMELRGEVNKENRMIYIYDRDYEEAVHTLVHEFFEYVFDLHLISPYVTLYNQMQKAMEQSFMENEYYNKEAIIEIFTELEIKKMKENKEVKKNEKPTKN